MLDAASLSTILASTNATEIVDALTARLDDLNSLSVTIDKKALLQLLKDVGCAKMGVRQKLATVLMCELQKAPRAITPPDDSKGEDNFWGSIISISDNIGFDQDGIPPPTSAAADLALLSAPKAPPAAAAVAKPPAELLARRAVREVDAAALIAAEASSTTPPLPPLPPPPPAAGAPATSAVTPPPPTAASPSNPAEEQANLFRKLGDEAFGRKDYAGGERWFTQALSSTPSSVALLLRLAQCCLARSPPAHHAALRHLHAIVALPPPHGDAHVSAARSCVAIGEMEEAIEHYDAHLRSEGASEALVSAYLARPSTPSESAAAAAQSALSPSAQKAADGRVEAVYLMSMVDKAGSHAKEGRTIEAIQAARAVRQACDATPLGVELAVAAHEAAGSPTDALEEARAGVAKLPSDPICAVLHARLLARTGSPAQAESELGAFYEAHGASPPPERADGVSRVSRALDGLRSARQSKDAGNAAYSSGQFERAITAYTAGLEADVEGCLAPTLLGNRSQACMKIGELANALRDCDTAVAIDGTAIKMRLRRAACRLELSQPDAAVGDYEAVLELDPENAAALAGLERAEEVASGADGRKGGLIDFEGEKLDPYEVRNLRIISVESPHITPHCSPPLE